MRLIVFCGPPGSGKTTLSKKAAKECGAVRHSMDEMGFFLHSDLIAPVVESLQAGKSVVVDGLYTKREWRAAILEATEVITSERILVYMTTPLTECIRRNAGRTNPLPDFVVEHIYNEIQPPALDEGWDEIKEVKTE